MSTVRMCDKCKAVFSELEDGWQTFSAATFKYDDDGNRYPLTQVMDACPDCAITPEPVLRRQIAKASESDELQARIAKLEKETGIVDA